MGDTRKNERHGATTGPQGTKVIRRPDSGQPSSEPQGESKDSSSVESAAIFIGINGAFKGKRFHVPRGRSTLGRDSTNDIVMDTETVSLVHARLVEKDGQWRVMNLLSTNGTWVNDKKVTDAVLRDGDSVSFGQAEFLFQQTQPQQTGKLRNIFRRWFGGG